MWKDSFFVSALALLLLGGLFDARPALAQEVCGVGTPLETPSDSETASRARAALDEGNRLAAKGDQTAALAAFAESASAAKSSGDATLATLAAASAARSNLLLRGTRGEPDDRTVVEELDRVLASAAALEDVAMRSRVELHVGRSFALMSKDRRAAESFSRAAEHATRAGAWRLHSYALGYLGGLYEERGRYDEAVSVTQRALFSAETSSAPDAIYRWHWQLGRLRLALSDPKAALTSFRASVSTIGDAKELKHADTTAIYDGLVGLLLDEAENAEQNETQQELLAETRTVLEDQNVSELRDYFRDPCLDAQRKAAPDAIPGTLVVYPVLLEERVVLISSLGGKFDSFRLPVGRDAFVEEIRAFRTTLEDRTTRSYLRHADKLYQWMIRPLEPALENGAVSTLVFVPRGALYTIPLAALYDGAQKRFLIEKVPLAITPGLTLTEPRAIDREATELLAAGVSESVQGYLPLDSVLDELGAISQEFPGSQLVNETFIATSFERELSEQPFGIVHVASHGEFSSDSAESFVLTYDGRISMDRLAELVGKTQFRSRSLELLTLSACESAAGDDRAALGLAGVALRAGARSALATLWSVNDRASAELMITFYEQLTKPNRSRAQALQTAQIGILKQNAYRHPTYWAPYLLVSSWL